jgi:hypothetical protein
MLTMVGALPPGGGPRIKMNVRTALRLESSESLVVEVTAQPAGQAAPRISRSVYRRTGPAPDSAPDQMEKARATLAQLGWIAGTWVGTAGTSTAEERWTPPAGGSMQAVARTLRSGMMTGFEFLCIVERDGGVVYQAMPNGRMPATDFPATRVEVDTVTFENPAHDFPKMIRYTKRPDGSLEAVISGAGGQRSQTFVFARQGQ